MGSGESRGEGAAHDEWGSARVKAKLRESEIDRKEEIRDAYSKESIMMRWGGEREGKGRKTS